MRRLAAAWAACMTLSCAARWLPDRDLAIAAVQSATVDARVHARGAALDAAIDDARGRLGGAVPNPTLNGFRRVAFAAAVAAGDLEGAARVRALWIPDPTSAKDASASARAALLSGAFDSARTLAWDAAERFPATRAHFIDLWLSAFARDPAFLAPIASIRAADLDGGSAIDRIRPLGGGSTLTYRLDSGGLTLAAFKPLQTRLQTNFRGEIAAFRLCALIHCGFEVPHNREIRIEHEAWYRLSGATTPAERRALDARNRDLVWTVDADGASWIHGTMKSWVLQFGQFEIERAGAWRELVSVDGDPRVDVEPLMATLLRGRAALDLDELSGPDLARQISNLHVFDYLLNNWDRYSGAFPGVNCQWSGDHFVSIDNGAAFPLPRIHGVTSARVRRNLDRVQVFSRRTIDAIRWLDGDRLYRLLFAPSPAADGEKARYEAFLARRVQLLERVDALVARHGADAVFGFP